MAMLDVVAAVLVLGAAGAFAYGATMLARSSDLEATVALVMGVMALRAGVEIVRPGAGHEP